MEKERIHNMIESFFHSELSNADESFLFTLLANDSEATERFKLMLKYREGINISKDEVPPEVEKKILSKTVLNIKRKRKQQYKLQSTFIYLLMVVLIFLSFFFYQKFNEYYKKIDDVEKIVNYQKEVIELFLNSLPAVNVNETLKNEVIVKKNL